MHATSGRARLAYEMTGAGDPVLLIHAGMTDRRSWRWLSSRLAPDHLVLTYDQRGYGETTYTPEPYSPVADAVAVLDAAGISRAAVVGCSMGGGAAVDLALEHPGRVSRLALIAPHSPADRGWRRTRSRSTRWSRNWRPRSRPVTWPR
ncbi:MAG: alpha/beta fold hydrolase [Kribbellaceae bacterium]